MKLMSGVFKPMSWKQCLGKMEVRVTLDNSPGGRSLWSAVTKSLRRSSAV